MRKLLFLTITASLLLPIACQEDDPLEKFTVYQDLDGDGFGNPLVSKEVVKEEDGYVNDNTDCDDTDAGINPDATEIEDNEIDENCDGLKSKTWYQDSDGDGYGNSAVSQVATTQPVGYVLDNTDCNDLNNAVNPGATEVSGDNGLDNNCDGMIEVVCGDGNVEGGEECDGPTDGAPCNADCTLGEQVCDDMLDNDGNGLIDCEDPKCQGTAACPLDQDGDSIPDSAEAPECVHDPNC